MIRTFTLLALTLIFNLSLKAQVVVDTMLFDGIPRYFRYYVPASYNSSDPAELVVNMHGYGSNALQQQSYSNMNAVADTAGFIVVYPDGVNNAWNSFSIAVGSSANDVGFINALLDTFVDRYNIDTTRMYACGMSNGGFMSYRLACELGDRLAAIASVTGLMDAGIMANCNSGRPMPVLQIHGTSDATVPYNGGTGLGSVDSTVAYWVGYNNCPTTAIIDSVPDYNTTDNSTAIRYSYQFCDSTTRVQLIKIVDGAHTWPGANIAIGTTNQDINASVEIWKFFKHHDLSGGDTGVDEFPTGVNDGLLLNDLVHVYPVPMTDNLTIDLLSDEVTQLSLYSILGSRVRHQYVQQGNVTAGFNTTDLPKGIYMLYIETAKGKLAYKLMK